MSARLGGALASPSPARWRAVAPRGRGLDLGAQAEQQLLLGGPRGQHHADGEAVLGPAEREQAAGMPVTFQARSTG